MNSECTFDIVMNRLKAAVNVGSDRRLAGILGVSDSGYANYKKRGSIPFEKVAMLAISQNVSMDWLLTGTGPIHRATPEGSAGASEEGRGSLPRDAAEGWLLALFRGLEEDGKHRVLDEARRIEQVAELRRRVAELEASKCPPRAEEGEEGGGDGISQVPPRREAVAIPEPPDQPFLAWLAQGLRDGRLSCNAQGARVHVVDAGVLLASPGIFRDYAALGAEPWETVQRRFQRLGLHVRTPRGENIHRYAVAGTGRTVQGYLLPDARRLFGADPPPPNPRLHRCPPARRTHA
jgi:hypothetical protein